MSGTTLFMGLVIGSVGAGYFIYGKKQRRWIPMVAGIGLFVMPYLPLGTGLTVAISLILCIIPFLIKS
ncbi:conserved hypothetical protein [Candidatus Zixiibacteriota bacterium]|nr:conserved hypothetical protein [candidate division Zixibacteria bacterium]